VACLLDFNQQFRYNGWNREQIVAICAVVQYIEKGSAWV
jgi:hypothetical protein